VQAKCALIPDIWRAILGRATGSITYCNEPDSGYHELAERVRRIVQRKLKMLDVAARVDDLELPPGNRLKVLKGPMKGRHSIRVNEQYRVTFRWENGHAFEVAVEDYH
jgi:proteic killer suppression protein